MEEKSPSEPEKIREWYDRTTRSWRNALAWITVLACAAAVGLWVLGSSLFTTKLQTFNGALTIPVAAGIWIAAFVYIFLIPSRECSFRGTESLERMEKDVRKAVEKTLPEMIEKEVKPAVEVWKRLGEKLEARFDGKAMDRLASAIEALSELSRPGPPPDVERGLAAFHRSRMSNTSSVADDQKEAL
jgi:hypothetical protein